MQHGGAITSENFRGGRKGGREKGKKTLKKFSNSKALKKLKGI